MAKATVSKLTPATEPKPKETTEPIITVNELIRRAASLGHAVEALKRAADHLRELSMMLYEAQDRRISTDLKGRFLSDTAQGTQILIDCQADEVEEIAEHFGKLAHEAYRLEESREGGAR